MSEEFKSKLERAYLNVEPVQISCYQARDILIMQQRLTEYKARFALFRENHKKDGQHILDGIDRGNSMDWVRAWVSDIANGKGHGGIQG